MFRRLGVAVLHQGRRLSTAKTPAGLVNSRSCGEFYTQELRPQTGGRPDLRCQRQEREELVGDGAARCRGEGGFALVSPDDYLASVQKELLDFFQKREDGSREVWDRVPLHTSSIAWASTWPT